MDQGISTIIAAVISVGVPIIAASLQRKKEHAPFIYYHYYPYYQTEQPTSGQTLSDYVGYPLIYDICLLTLFGAIGFILSSYKMDQGEMMLVSNYLPKFLLGIITLVTGFIVVSFRTRAQGKVFIAAFCYWLIGTLIRGLYLNAPEFSLNVFSELIFVAIVAFFGFLIAVLSSR